MELVSLGVNQIASIVTCRFMDATGNGWVSDAIRCFDYCMSFDSHVISNSWGGVAYSDSLQVSSWLLMLSRVLVHPEYQEEMVILKKVLSVSCWLCLCRLQ